MISLLETTELQVVRVLSLFPAIQKGRIQKGALGWHCRAVIGRIRIISFKCSKATVMLVIKVDTRKVKLKLFCSPNLGHPSQKSLDTALQ